MEIKKNVTTIYTPITYGKNYNGFARQFGSTTWNNRVSVIFSVKRDGIGETSCKRAG